MIKTVESNEKEEDEKEEEGDENVVEYTTKRSSVVQFDTAKLPSMEECSATESKKTIKTVTTQNSQVFFMIGCQRSGSNVSIYLGSFSLFSFLLCFISNIKLTHHRASPFTVVTYHVI